MVKGEKCMFDEYAYGITEEEYYSFIQRMGFSRTRVPTLFTREQETYFIPLASTQTPQQRVDTLKELRASAGLDLSI